MFMRMIYDERLAQAAYLIGCQKTGEAIIVDPERDVDRYIELAHEHNLRIVATTETHIHADFLSGSRELAELVGARVHVSDEGDADWKYQWLDKKTGGGSYDYQLLKNGDSFSIGNIEFQVVHTPGHTPEHIAFLVIDHGSGATEPMGMISGDFVFVGDLGRPDLLETAAGQAGAMEPSARTLYKTVQTLGAVPDFVQVWPAHGAGSACGKALGAIPSSTIGYERRFNPAIRAASNEDAFVDFILSGQPEPPLYFANMKRDNKIGPRVLGGLPSVPRISIDDLRQLDTQANALIDTRPWERFASGHVPGSLSLPLIKSFCTDAGSLVNEHEDIYLIVTPEEREDAIRLLIRIGLDRIRGWVDAAQIGAYQNETARFSIIEQVSPDEAESMLAEQDAQVLDVRRATEYDEGHIDNAINIAHTRLASRLDELPAGKAFIVQCRSGVRSARASAFLQRGGFKVFNLKGGYLAWAKAHDEQPASL